MSQVPLARHTKLRRTNPVVGFVKGIAFAVSAVLVAGIGVGAYAYHDYFGTLQDNSVVLSGQDVDPPAVEVLPNDDVNILVTGVDKCEEGSFEQFGARCPQSLIDEQKESYGGQLNDVNMIIHISPEPRHVTVISLPRDLMTARPECYDDHRDVDTPGAAVAQFNTAYSNGGLDCVARSASLLTGLEIDHAALMTWNGVIEITNAIGGVTVCLENPIPYDKETELELGAGEHVLVGYQALQFLRTRKTLATGSDLDRIGNQQLYMGALVRQMTSEDTFGDIGKLLRLAKAVTGNAQVSSGIANPMALVSIAGALRGIPIEDYTFIQFPAMDDPADTNRLLPVMDTWSLIAEALEKNQVIELGDDEPTAEPTPDATETPTVEPTPGEERVTIPGYLRGSNAANNAGTCGTPEGLF
jgi:LCP family protein required for cell wall assembly